LVWVVLLGVGDHFIDETPTNLDHATPRHPSRTSLRLVPTDTLILLNRFAPGQYQSSFAVAILQSRPSEDLAARYTGIAMASSSLAARPLLVGIDIGGTRTRAMVAMSPRGQMLRRSIATPNGGSPIPLVEAVVELVREVALEYGGVPVAAGIASAGTVDTREGVVLESPNLPNLLEVPLARMISEGLGVPATLENDATAAALAEYRMGAGRGTRDLVYITVSTGIGGGIITNGALYRGALGGAGEFGHMVVEPNARVRCACGRTGCWETLASGTAVTREAKARLRDGRISSLRDWGSGSIEALSARDIFEAARGGDDLSQEVIARAAHYFGVGLANVLNALNPERIVIGGGLSKDWDEFVEPAARIAREQAFPLHASRVEIVPSALGDDNGLRGGLFLAQQIVSDARRSARSRLTPLDGTV
ncbi:MAG: ROK family protein, partial [Chloroflexi bacterium]|nr:ROK family protein [Chloroflexota bacterium]